MLLLDYLQKIPDQRRPQGRMYDLPHLLLFSILAIASGANSYRKIGIFIKEHFVGLSKTYQLTWKRPPSYNAFGHTIRGLDLKKTEKAFRAYSAAAAALDPTVYTTVSLDGKALKHSFDNAADLRFRQILSAFTPGQNIILAHETIGVSKDNEINAAITLMKDLGIDHVVYTLDALHTQKKR
jgi:hypothetical protein